MNLRPQFTNQQEQDTYRVSMIEAYREINKELERRSPEVAPVDIEEILQRYPSYEWYCLLSGRGRAKTTGVLAIALIDAMTVGCEFAYVRRIRESFRTGSSDIFAPFNSVLHSSGLNFIELLTNGLANTIVYKARCWYLCRIDPDTREKILDDYPLGHSAAVSEVDNSKGLQWPLVGEGHIIYDEVTTRANPNGLSAYLPSEGVKFLNLCKSIVREKTGCKIWCLGNTVNKYCPVFAQIGLSEYHKAKEGDIQEYTSRTEDGETHILFYNLPPADRAKVKTRVTSNRYFCFNSPEIQQITAGRWEVSAYPSTPAGHSDSFYVYEFFVMWKDEVLHCHICDPKSGPPYIYIHPKTTPLSPEQESNCLIYSEKRSIRGNWRRRIYAPELPVEKAICNILKADRVYYASNECGEIMRNYLAASKLSE